ncbi:hypothetical protein MUK42_05725 [Musa troglodytarum]|uniref:Uncharacterized protein n=1 Tax=Musa troglodytarum TaxID=320322 RepID=A0A9E7G7K3_9LILI|nr:hypothetical protein MUK42_05725 [Musa troglodytarum]
MRGRGRWGGPWSSPTPPSPKTAHLFPPLLSPLEAFHVKLLLLKMAIQPTGSETAQPMYSIVSRIGIKYLQSMILLGAHELQAGVLLPSGYIKASMFTGEIILPVASEFVQAVKQLLLILCHNYCPWNPSLEHLKDPPSLFQYANQESLTEEEK